ARSIRLSRRRELHELDLVELMLAIYALHVLAVRTRLAAVARRERGVAPGQRRLGQRLAGVKRRQRDFRRRNEIERAPLVGLHGFEQLLLELRQLPPL